MLQSIRIALAIALDQNWEECRASNVGLSDCLIKLSVISSRQTFNKLCIRFLVKVHSELL